MADTDTTRYAHVLLPAAAWGEKDGTVTNSERRISRQRPTWRRRAQARADWRIIADVAAAMGHGEAFDWRVPGQVFREYARLTAYENQGRTLNLGPLAGMTADQYEALEPVQWPVTAQGGTAAVHRWPVPHAWMDARAWSRRRPEGRRNRWMEAFPSRSIRGGCAITGIP
jgi:assimilatory nitrate reductase catalytic subunit